MVEKEKSTIALFNDTKVRLDKAKLCSDETYDNEINRILDEREA